MAKKPPKKKTKSADAGNQTVSGDFSENILVGYSNCTLYITANVTLPLNTQGTVNATIQNYSPNGLNGLLLTVWNNAGNPPTPNTHIIHLGTDSIRPPK
jgi:hypothetical protein